MESDERGSAPTGGERLVLWTRALGAIEEVIPFVDGAASRFRVAGGEPLATLGGSVAIAFEEFDAVEAAQMATELLAAAPEALDVAIGAAFGPIRLTSPGVAQGEAIDRAQWLCHRARRGDLLVDDAARSLLSQSFLFAPPSIEEAGARRGHPVDRGAPTLPECRAAVGALSPPALPETHRPLVETLRELSRAPGSAVVLVRGSSAAGFDLVVEHSRRDAAPRLTLSLAPIPLGLEPLGSLRYGLIRLFATDAALESGCARLGEDEREAIRSIRDGRPIEPPEAARATAALLEASSGEGKPWIVVDPLSSIDVSTARLVRSLLESGPETLLVGRVPQALALPPDAFGKVAPTLLELHPLGEHGAALAASLLGVAEEAEEAKFVAALGGSSPLGVIEAARTLVSRGDLVQRGEAFAFRQRLKPRKSSVPLQRLLAERLRGLETSALRMLEIVSLCPPGTPNALFERALNLDGLSENERAEARALLARERWIADDGSLSPGSEPIRASVLKLMAPARRLELHSFVARAAEEHARGAFAKVASATHFRAAGESEGPARALMETAEAASSARHLRAALKLAATAVEWSRSPEIRHRAAALARADGRPASSDERTGSGEPPSLSARWIDALRARDFELADRVIDEGVAEGAPLSTAETLRAWMALARGDHAAARDLTSASPVGAAAPRLELVRAWIELAEGRSRHAIARALAVLSTARREADRSAEGAALSTLAACFAASGRGEDAAAIDQLAASAASISRALRSKSA